MNCLSRDELIDHLFSQDRSAAAAAEAHFAACAACRSKIETLKQLEAAAASVPPAPVSGDFTARLMRELKVKSPAPAASPSLYERLFGQERGFALAAFAGVLIVSAAFFAAQRGLAVNPARTLYFSDGPATVNNGFPMPENMAAGADLPGKRAPGYVYTDNCSAVNCGLL